MGIALIVVAIAFAVLRKRRRKVKTTRQLESPTSVLSGVDARYVQPTSSLKELEGTSRHFELPGSARDMRHEMMNSIRR